MVDHGVNDFRFLNVVIIYYLFFIFFLSYFYFFPASGQAVASGVVPSSPRYVPSVLIAHRVHSAFPLLVDFNGMLLTHAFALSANC